MIIFFLSAHIRGVLSNIVKICYLPDFGSNEELPYSPV